MSDHSRTAWLVIAAGNSRQHAGNDGYQDEPPKHYSWDSTVPNHASIKCGDAIVLWDKRLLIGASVIDAISIVSTRKARHRCPHCGKASFKERKTKAPKFLFFACGQEFEEPESRLESVTSYCSEHGESWVDLDGVLTGEQLRALCTSPASQHSLRRLDWRKFRLALARASGSKHSLARLDARLGWPMREEQRRKVSSCVEQGPFRAELLARFGFTCALTGSTPPEVLDAVHLFSRAGSGEHREDGGLLLRHDVHRLLMHGLITVEPDCLTVAVSADLDDYPLYARMRGQRLAEDLDPRVLTWLAHHWAEHSAVSRSLRSKTSRPVSL